MQKQKCEKCGKSREGLILSLVDGKWICANCSDQTQQDTFLQLPIPEGLLFVAKAAKFGKKRRIIEIPKTIRDLVRDSQKYYVQLTPLEGNK
jgi:hypothetical protein